MALSRKLSEILARFAGVPEADRIANVGELRGLLNPLIPEAKALEESRASADADILITQLQAKAKDNELLLATMQKEINSLLEEKKKREEEDSELDKNQLWVLQALPPPSKDGWKAYQISSRLGLSPDEVDARMDMLVAAKYVDSGIDQIEKTTYRRSKFGNQYVVKLKLAEENPVKLTQEEGELLAMIYRCREEGVGETFMLNWFKEHGRGLDWGKKFKSILIRLLCCGFISPSDSIPTYGQGELWFMEPAGISYVTEHNLVR